MSSAVVGAAEGLRIDPAAETARIVEALQRQLHGALRRRGIVVGLSGGVDSSVVAALAARAVGPQKVLGVLMPERESDPESLALGRLVAERFGIPVVLEDITPILEAAGCYRRRDEAIRRVFPDYGEGFRSKIATRKTHAAGYNVSYLVVQAPDGALREARMPIDVYLGIVAATSMKQRTRKQMEYYHADRLNFAVAGTPNRLEYDQGFFVKNGDGAADVKPIAHLYKSQVYQLAEHLGVPEAIRARPPTTDTYSLEQTQEEFYFGIPLAKLDLCLHALDHGLAPEAVASEVGLEPSQVSAVFRDIASKRRSARYLHAAPLVVETA